LDLLVVGRQGYQLPPVDALGAAGRVGTAARLGRLRGRAGPLEEVEMAGRRSVAEQGAGGENRHHLKSDASQHWVLLAKKQQRHPPTGGGRAIGTSSCLASSRSEN